MKAYAGTIVFGLLASMMVQTIYATNCGDFPSGYYVVDEVNGIVPEGTDKGKWLVTCPAGQETASFADEQFLIACIAPSNEGGTHGDTWVGNQKCYDICDDCGEHGDCSFMRNGYECVCKAGFEGEKCDVAICEHDCGNYGKCEHDDNEAKNICECDAGWTGPECKTPQPCALKPCNYGMCYENLYNTYSYECQCDYGWTGKYCDKRSYNYGYQGYNSVSQGYNSGYQGYNSGSPGYGSPGYGSPGYNSGYNGNRYQ